MEMIADGFSPMSRTEKDVDAPLTLLNRPQCLIEPLNEILSSKIAIVLVQMRCQVSAYLLVRERGIGPLVFAGEDGCS